MKKIIFRLTTAQQKTLANHLHPGDGLEAVAIGLCGTASSSDRDIVILHEIYTVPHNECERHKDKVIWSAKSIKKAFEKALEENLTIVKFHSHPKGYKTFSELDNVSDHEFIKSASGWSTGLHSSLVMLPSGKLFGRWYSSEGVSCSYSRISIVGHHLKFFDSSLNPTTIDNEVSTRNRQAYGKGTIALLETLKIGVVGCSGTGSPLIEILARTGVGELLLIDPDKIEEKNLNRILNTTIDDAKNNSFKTKVLQRAINQMGFNTKIKTFDDNIYDNLDAIKELSTCDIVFGCMDSIDGRHLLNSISTYYSIPYFDLGVKLIANDRGDINSISTLVHYILPGQSLIDRKVYTLDQLEAADLKRSAPEEYRRRKNEGYIANIDEESPTVLSVNMRAASDAFNEFMDRVHHFRSLEETQQRAKVSSSIIQTIASYKSFELQSELFTGKIGRGDTTPLLDKPHFSIKT